MRLTRRSLLAVAAASLAAPASEAAIDAGLVARFNAGDDSAFVQIMPLASWYCSIWQATIRSIPIP